MKEKQTNSIDTKLELNFDVIISEHKISKLLSTRDFLLTGSFKFNKNLNSDIDICVLSNDIDDDFHNIINLGGKYNKSYLGENFKSVYLKTKLKLYNFLFMEEIEFKKWKQATDAMVQLYKNKYFNKQLSTNKIKRVGLFEYLKEI